MSTSKNILKKFILTTALITLILFIFNYSIIVMYMSEGVSLNSSESPENLLTDIENNLKLENGEYYINDNTKTELKNADVWAMLINNDGSVIWNYDLPKDVPLKYSLTDVALFSRNYLNSYPVYSWKYNENLIVIGYPKDKYAKYQYTFPVEWVKSVPIRILVFLLLNILLALILSLFIGSKMIKSIKLLISALEKPSKGEFVKVNCEGVLKGISNSINETSIILKEKDELLKKKDKARLSYIAGISHDIRTPLSMILGYSSELQDNENLSLKEREEMRTIVRQSIKIKSLISDLNLVSSLEYDMQPVNLKKVRISSLLREIICDFINNDLDEKYDISFENDNENIIISCDENLIKRAITNLIQNSINHNPNGCSIVTKLICDNSNNCIIKIYDDGIGITKEKLQDILKTPYEKEKISNDGTVTHGLGLVIINSIIKAHKGEFIIENDIDKGFSSLIKLPI